jgi:hypothetical protein
MLGVGGVGGIDGRDEQCDRRRGERALQVRSGIGGGDSQRLGLRATGLDERRLAIRLRDRIVNVRLARGEFNAGAKKGNELMATRSEKKMINVTKDKKAGQVSLCIIMWHQNTHRRNKSFKHNNANRQCEMLAKTHTSIS